MFKSAKDILGFLGTNTGRNLYLFNLDGLDILRQLRFEEFIYRNASPVSHNSSFFLTNSSHIDHSVVFGLSGNPGDFIRDFELCKRQQIKLIKRFTGGGTVLVDANTVTCSFVGTHAFAPSLQANHICGWTFENVYRRSNMFKSNFSLVDGDFVVKSTNGPDSTENIESNGSDDRETFFKVGGNAQAFSKHAFVHHTCFVWALSPLIPKVLLIPKRMPKYRNNREHECFLSSVSDCLRHKYLNKSHFSHSLTESLQLDVENVFKFKYRPSGRVDHFDLSDELVDSCIEALIKPNTVELPY